MTPQLLSELKTDDPREFGYRSAMAGPKVEYFLERRCAGMSEADRELAIEGWNEFQEERGGDRASLMIGVQG